MDDDRANLLSAYSSGDIDGVINLIYAGASPFTTDDKGNTLFHLCCTNNTHGPRILQSLLAAMPFLSVISSVNNDGNTPLHLACSNGLTECVQLLLSRSPVIFNVVTDNMIQCITDAASWEIIQLLLMKITLRGLMDTCNKCECTRHFLTLFPKNNEHFQLSDGMTTLLHLVATSGDLEYFTTTLFSIGLNISCFDSEGYTPLHRAIEYGCVSIAKYLINQPNCLCETLTYKYTAPLHDAAGEYGDISIVQCLVERGVDINVSTCEGTTPLHYSCRWGHLSIVEYLTSLPQFNYTRDSWGRTGIHYAAEFGQAHVVKYLTEVRGYDINVEDKYGNTPLYMACYYDHLPVVEYLTSDINSNKGSHPLIVATDKERLNIVKYLIDSKGCDINVREKATESTPLHKACYNGSLSIVEYLISKPQCNIEARDSKGNQPLYYAVCQGHKEIILLLGEKISMDGLSECIRLTEMQAQPEIIKILKNIYKLLQENIDSLLEACESGHIDIIRHLVISKYCDINYVKGLRGYTPLHYACENGKYEIVKILTDRPECNIEAENIHKDRAVHVACESQHDTTDIVRHLVIDKHCDINAKGTGGYTPLHYACENCKYEIVKILTDRPECNIEAENFYKTRAVHVACKSQHDTTDIVRHLVIDKHCDINVKGWNGYTPLHYACAFGKYEIVKFLTDNPKCDMEAENHSHRKPLQVALDYGRGDRQMRTNAIKIMKHLVGIKGCSTHGIISYDTIIQDYLCRAQQFSGIALLCVVKCILTGPPGAGKSTLKKRLLNQSLDAEPSLSTGVVDAAVQVNSFRKLSQHNAVVTTEWKEQELDEEAVLITKKLLPSNITTDKSITSQSTLSSVENNISSSVPLEETDLTLATVEQNTNASSSPIEARITTGETSNMEHENVNAADIVNDDEEEGVTDIQVQDSSSTVVSGLSNYVMNIPAIKRHEYEWKFKDLKDDDHTMLHIIDTGGQPEFHEILPALITGPAINLLVFKLTEDLRSRYKIIYRSPTGESNPYETSLTHEEVIFRSLASIACLRQNTIGWSFDEAPIEDESEPAAFLIATHRDQVEENKVDEVNQQLRTKIENSSHLFHSNLVQFSQSDQVIFPLDTRKDEEEIKHLRSILHRVISERFHELKIPASWCTLSLKLRKSKRKLFKYDTCFQLAQECGIKNKEEFQNALWYLHHRVGIIMYYPNVKGLEDIIITDLQLVFDRITNLITTCFTFEQLGSAAVEKEFRKNGRFSVSQLDEISLREKGDPLNSKRLVALLKHLYIVAGPMKTKVGRKNVNYYFMPCALKPADVEREERDKSLSSSPLLICFECGYTPVGVFCCLVVYLLDQKTDQVLQWKLTGNDQYRNRISFEVGQYYDTVILISRATYLEVWVQQRRKSSSTSDLCDKILLSLHKGLETVTESLHYTYKSRHMFGVPCTACPTGSVPHPAVIEHCEEVAKCINGNIMDLDGEKHLLWSKKVMLIYYYLIILIPCR